MKTIEYHTVDKSGWGAGPWQSEPDKRQWQDEATGLPCLIVRGPVGALCGYVGVGAQHPLHSKDYSDPHCFPCGDHCSDDWHSNCRPESNFEVHGGLTFSGGCGHHENPGKGICHVPGEGEPDDIWWFGFDCAHYGDYAPSNRISSLARDGVYRDFAYVQAEVTALAKQVAAVLP